MQIRAFLKNLLIAAVVPFCFFLLLELLLRAIRLPQLLAPGKDDLVLEMPTWMLREESSRERAARISGDAETLEWLNLFEEGLGFRVRLTPGVSAEVVNTFSRLPDKGGDRYKITANRLGFRGREVEKERAPGTFRILVFGDSSSFGWGVNEDQIFSALLEDQLRRHTGREIEIANFAIPGDSSEYGRLIFDNFAEKYSPDLVILGFGANDAKLSRVPHAEQVSRFAERHTLHTIRFWLDKSALFASLSRAAELVLGDARATQNLARAQRSAVPRKRYRQNIKYMINKSRSFGAQQVMVLTLCTPGDYARTAASVAEHRNAIFVNGQAHLLNVLEELKQNPSSQPQAQELAHRYGALLKHEPLLLLSSDGCHPNALGHRLIAEKLRDEILAHNLLTDDVG